MRKLLFLLTLILAACGGNGDGSKTGPEPVQHVPEMSNLQLSPDSAVFMENGGSIVVNAEITFSDAGRDIAAMWVEMPDGTSFKFDESVAAATGTLTEDLTMPTNQLGEFLVEVWLVDESGDSSAHHVIDFTVSGDMWTSRLNGLPYVLQDVVWNGTVFVAVGSDGRVLTSADGIDWVPRALATDAHLHGVASFGAEIVAVGSEIVLLSDDHGETWVTKQVSAETTLGAVAVNSSQVVVAGRNEAFDPIMMISEDRGDTWQVIDSWPDQPMYFTDLAYRDGLFVAAADTRFFIREGGGWVFVSPDGKLWNDIYHDPESGFLTVIDEGSRFTVAGSDGAAISSIDGFNWMAMQTPVEGGDYWNGASNGSTLVLAGGYECIMIFCPPPYGDPFGIVSSDGGVSWDIFSIGGDYRSSGMAFGNGRFVSVGEESGEGAIYTSP